MQFRVKTQPQSLALASALFCAVLPFALAQEGGQSEDRTNKNVATNRKVQKVSMVAERFNFTPSKIKVPLGTLLEITLTSDDTFHGFRIPSMQINQVIPARGRGSVKVSVDAKEKGTFAFECSRPCGAGHTMMRGVIIVE
jgi:heme/copper-type cytochrome/quinol oxidase subunit 2